MNHSVLLEITPSSTQSGWELSNEQCYLTLPLIFVHRNLLREFWTCARAKAFSLRHLSSLLAALCTKFEQAYLYCSYWESPYVQDVYRTSMKTFCNMNGFWNTAPITWLLSIIRKASFTQCQWINTSGNIGNIGTIGTLDIFRYGGFSTSIKNALSE